MKFAAVVVWSHDVGKCECSIGLHCCFKNDGATILEELFRLGKGFWPTKLVNVDEHACAVGIVDLLSEFSYLIADGKDHLGCRVISEFGLVDF